MSFEVRHEFTSVDGVRLHWAELGKATNAPPLILLHGLNDCYLTWRRVAPLLAAGRRILMPDLPGHGSSSRPDASYALRWYARILALWIEALDLDQADVVGHSFGGGVAQMLLLACRARIRRLGLLASGGLGREIAFVLRLAAIPRVVEHLGQPFMGPLTRFTLATTRRGLSAEDSATLAAMNAQPGSARAFARTVGDIIDWRGQRRAFMDGARAIGTLPPIAVFWGEEDAVIPVSHGWAMASALQKVDLTLFAGCGHYPQDERPTALAGALRTFLEDPSVEAAQFQPVSAAPSRAHPRVLRVALPAAVARRSPAQA